MKKLFAVLTLTLFSISAFSNGGGDSDNTKEAKELKLISVAKAHLKSQCNNLKGDLAVSVNSLSTCFGNNKVTEVTFFKTIKCSSQQKCDNEVEVVGSITFDCDNNVINLTCGKE
jgi:hypothetical protein